MSEAIQPQITQLGIREISTSPSVFKSRVICVAMIALSTLAFPVYKYYPLALEAFLDGKLELEFLWEKAHFLTSLHAGFKAIAAVGLLCLITGAIGFIRNKISYILLQLSAWAVIITMAVFIWVMWQGIAAITSSDIDQETLGLDYVALVKMWSLLAFPCVLVAIYAFWLKIMLRSRSVNAAYTKASGNPMSGDHVLENLRTHGRDPRHRRSVYASAFTHFMIIFAIPWLLSLGGCVEAYKVPQGSGTPAVAQVKMVKPKEKKKTLTLRPNSAIIFDQPDLDNTEVDEIMQEKTELTYQANPGEVGKLGKGGGDKGGWPEGAEDYKIRFIRLEHGGPGWDDGMNQTAADMNFLKAFAQATPFKKIANRSESHPIALLKKYPDDGFPPFVYLTGNGSMGRVSSTDAKILREYCLKGGMLIADAGSARFHQSFTHFMRQVFPDKPLIDIADDDMIYQIPYSFPDGAPAFWHHGGRRPLGVKHEGRWVVFYHPGDMNDAWKSQGYTDVTPEMREAAMNLGINLIYYSFTQWNDAMAKQRK